MSATNYKAFISNGAYRRELYTGKSGAKAIEAGQAAAQVLMLYQLTGVVYVFACIGQVENERIWFRRYRDGKYVEEAAA